MKKLRNQIAACTMALAVLWTAVPPMMGHAEGETDKENIYIANDETGIPDETLYEYVLKVNDSNGDGKLSVAEAESVKLIGIGNSWSGDPEVVSLKGIRFFPNLVDLEMENLSLRDIGEISELHSLKRLELINTELASFPDISGMSDLQFLVISGNDLTQLPDLDNLICLEYLDFSNNQISDLSEISSLINLEYLNAGENNIDDLSPISGLTQLVYLDLHNNSVCSLKPLSGLTKLTMLDVGNNQIDNLQDISSLINITDLNICNNKISDISAIKDMGKLADLTISNNEIRDLSPLIGLTELFWIEAENNYITNLDSLSGLVNLQALFLENNEISDLSPVCNLTQLMSLQVGNNCLEKLPDLTGLQNLETSNPKLDDDYTSDFRGNQITEAEARAKLPQQLLDDTEWFEAQGFLKETVDPSAPGGDISIGDGSNPSAGDSSAPSTGDNTNTSTDNNNGATAGENNTDTTPYQVELTSEQTVISADTFTTLLTENANRPVVIKSNEDVTFTFAAGTMKAVEGKTDYDFGVKVVKQYDKIPESVQGRVSQDNFVAHIEYNYSGQLPAAAQIRIRLGSEYIGKTFYYYLENEDGSLKYIQSAAVDSEGYITVTQSHCSNYVLLDQAVGSDTVKTGDETPVSLYGISLLTGAAGMIIAAGAAVRQRRRER